MSDFTKIADVSGVHGVIHDADQHEQPRFEQRVREGVQRCRSERGVRADADGRDDPAELGHRRVRHELLEVEFLEREQGRHDRGAETDRDEQRPPHLQIRKCRREAHGEEDAGLDDRRRVQIGRHRRCSGHGSGEPVVKRPLGRFGECGNRDEHCDERRHGDVVAPYRALERGGNPVGPGVEPRDRYPGEKRETTGECRGQRPHRRRERRTTGTENQRETRQRRDFPTDVEDGEGIGEDEQQHAQRERGDELVKGIPGSFGERGSRRQLRMGRNGAGFGRDLLIEVCGGVDEDDDTDPQREKCEEHPDRLTDEHRLPAPGRYPGNGCRRCGTAAENGRCLGEERHKSCEVQQR